jgi:hypothetical protein
MNNVKTKTNKPVEAAPAADADVLREFDRLYVVLSETHGTIPTLLARERDLNRVLGLSEARGNSDADGLRQQLDDTVRERQAAIRRRVASVDALLEMEPALRSDRGIVETERRQVAAEVAQDFGKRWQQACDALAVLRAEAGVLSAALRTTIACPAPYIPFVHAIREQPELRPVAGPEQPPTAALPAHLSILVRRLDALDSAMARVSAIQQSKQLDSRHYDLSKIRGTPAEFPGVFLVTGEFDSLVDGMKFAPGTLVDATLIGPGQLARLTVARRYLRPADLHTGAAA